MTPRIVLKNCPKKYNRDLDKATDPLDTIKNVRQRLKNWPEEVFAGCRRIDTGRLGIPVYLGICGSAAKAVMPTRKQMGKGSSPEQAEASAIMELMERYAFFSFWENMPFAVRLSWTDAKRRFGDKLIPVNEIIRSVNDSISAEDARKLLDLTEWQFYPATDLATGENVWLPLDWFRMLGEFNGSSAGNTAEESLLQGVSELIERHVCCLIDMERPELPTISQTGITDPVLRKLCEAFRQNGIELVLKDISLGMPLPTVAALAWDPATFPLDSEIVFTAGTATSPAKAAIRAITEVAQLGGDFCTHSCYEASGLPKFTALAESDWLKGGPVTSLANLPNAESSDIREELGNVVKALAPLRVFAVETTHPGIGVPAHYCMIPGLQFRERDKNQSLGLFVGRKLVEESPAGKARQGLDCLNAVYPDAHFLPFFEGMLALRGQDPARAAALFSESIERQPENDARALAAFYAGYAHTQHENWAAALPYLEQALTFSPTMKEAANLLGVAAFKLHDYAKAEAIFDAALAIDKGSAIDLANRGVARRFLGKRDEAIHDLEAALALDHSLSFASRHLKELEAE